MNDRQDKFLKVINDNKKIILKICHLYTNTTTDRADLYQEIVFQLWKSFDKFENRAKISTWIYKVALNTALYFLRNKKKKQTVFSDIDFSSVEIPDQANELMLRLKEMIDTLTPFEKSLITLQLEGLSYKEIAQITGISETNVGTKLYRIRKKLKKIANQ